MARPGPILAAVQTHPETAAARAARHDREARLSAHDAVQESLAELAAAARNIAPLLEIASVHAGVRDRLARLAVSLDKEVQSMQAILARGV